jgi:hypothetical protein
MLGSNVLQTVSTDICVQLHEKFSEILILQYPSRIIMYTSGIQPGVRVPPGVREDILGGT